MICNSANVVAGGQGGQKISEIIGPVSIAEDEFSNKWTVDRR